MTLKQMQSVVARLQWCGVPFSAHVVDWEPQATYLVAARLDGEIFILDEFELATVFSEELMRQADEGGF